MARLAVRGLKKSYSIGRKRLVSWELRHRPCFPIYESFIPRAFKNSESPHIMRVSEGASSLVLGSRALQGRER